MSFPSWMSQLENVEVVGQAVVKGKLLGLGCCGNGVISRRHSFDAISGVVPPVDHVNVNHCPVPAGMRICPGFGRKDCFWSQSTGGAVGVPGRLLPRTSRMSGLSARKSRGGLPVVLSTSSIRSSLIEPAG